MGILCSDLLLRTKRSYTRRITVTAIMTIVILVLLECFKVVYNNNNIINDDESCVNVCRGSEKKPQSKEDFNLTDV